MSCFQKVLTNILTQVNFYHGIKQLLLQTSEKMATRLLTNNGLMGLKVLLSGTKKLAAAGGVLASGGANANVPSAQSEDGLLKDTGDVLGEIMAGANRGVVDALNFFTVDQINAI